jgi:hypothetical protein
MTQTEGFSFSSFCGRHGFVFIGGDPDIQRTSVVYPHVRFVKLGVMRSRSLEVLFRLFDTVGSLHSRGRHEGGKDLR